MSNGVPLQPQTDRVRVLWRRAADQASRRRGTLTRGLRWCGVPPGAARVVELTS